MLIIGLTGSIATGKSTVSSLLTSQHHLPLIDADLIARQVVAPGTPGYNAIVSYFLPTTPDLLLPAAAPSSPPPLNRAALGRRVFNDPEALKKLNSITHPLVRKSMLQQIIKAYLCGHWACVLDVPLLLEAGMESICGAVILVTCSPETQFQRLMARDGERLAADAGGREQAEREARKRVESQMGMAEKERRVEEWKKDGRGWIVKNDGGLEELKLRVGKVIEEVAKYRRGVWGWSLWGCPPFAALVAALNWWRTKKRMEKYRGEMGGKKGKAKL
ncbi:CoaE-domain-containing protein [Ascodesmis nigricans]|uniref:CoaE-domain-containing protein n=1 Tax=Ascodesmis nigricans TaxID=341454 RepID=A0A4S2N8P1_9PEZI|nr:CoaE-domain-containing protein [Ascodesmis nigricans]